MTTKSGSIKNIADDDNDTIDKMWISKFTLCLYPIQYLLLFVKNIS